MRSDISDYSTGLNEIYDSDIIRNRFQISTRTGVFDFDLTELLFQTVGSVCSDFDFRFI